MQLKVSWYRPTTNPSRLVLVSEPSFLIFIGRKSCFGAASSDSSSTGCDEATTSDREIFYRAKEPEINKRDATSRLPHTTQSLIVFARQSRFKYRTSTALTV